MRTKECPSCAMDVDAKAQECPICNYEFAEIKASYKWVAIFLIIIMLWYIIF